MTSENPQYMCGFHRRVISSGTVSGVKPASMIFIASAQLWEPPCMPKRCCWRPDQLSHAAGVCCADARIFRLAESAQEDFSACFDLRSWKSWMKFRCRWCKMEVSVECFPPGRDATECRVCRETLVVLDGRGGRWTTTCLRSPSSVAGRPKFTRVCPK